MTETETCANCRRPVHHGWVVCSVCTDRCIAQLRQIPRMHQLLAGSPTMKEPPVGERGRRGRGNAPAAPANLHAVALTDRRSDVRSVLAPWLEDLHEQMALAGQGTTSDVAAMCGALAALVPWAAQHHPAASDLCREISEQHRLLAEVVRGEKRPPRPVRCPAVAADSQQCTGRLQLHPDGSVSCETCSTVWSFDEWHRHGATLQVEYLSE